MLQRNSTSSNSHIACMAEPGEPSRISEFHVLGVRVHAVQIPDVVCLMRSWIANREGSHFIAVTGMHGISEALSSPSLQTALNSADLVVPDGKPLVWLGRWHGYALKRRVYGPELMLSFCEATADETIRHFFYGGAPGVADQLVATLRSQFPRMNIAGTYTPPFRPLTVAEESDLKRLVDETRPDIMWIGLSTPKQEHWMFEHRACLTVPVMVGVGAAFDLNTGRVRQAPRWMRERGLEWFFRLTQEPKRLWRRYLCGGTKFLFYVGLELTGIRSFPKDH